MRLTSKVALVSGGGSGIGAATARRFAAEGASVVLLGRRAEPLERVAADIGGIAIAGDATRTDDVRRAVQAAIDRFGGLDVLVANAGGEGTPEITATDDAAWNASIDSNLTSTFVQAREALPALIERRGSIVVMSSIAGVTAPPDDVGYTTSKHALIGLTRSLARDYGRHGVRVNVICPGWVRTKMVDATMDRLSAQRGISHEEAYALVTADVPLGRPATADEIASICVFLASSDSSIMTGAVVMADGGASVVDVPTLVFDRGSS